MLQTLVASVERKKAEGNSLTLRETAEVIEHGITVGGKTLRDHKEVAEG